MHVNTRMNRSGEKVIRKTSAITKIIGFAMLGLEGKQWLASFMIGMILLPIFSTPASAFSIPKRTEDHIKQYEPVNAEVTLLEQINGNLNAKIEEWRTPWRKVNIIHDENEKDYKGNAKGEKKSEDGETDGKDSSKINDKNRNIKNPKKSANKELTEKGEDEENLTEDDALNKLNAADENKVKRSEKPELSSIALPSKTNSVLVSPQSADRPILDDSELPVLVSNENNLGSPLGQTESAGMVTPAAATKTRERAGIGNFGFGLPAASLPGRGISASVGISYNSQLWTKSSNKYTYNVDGNWLAPGFHIGYGYLDVYRSANNNPSTIVMTEAGGTRRQLDNVSTQGGGLRDYLFKSNDGSFTKAEFLHCSSGCTDQTTLYDLRATYSDGSIVYFTNSNPQDRYFPKKIVDVQGNYITIEYLANDEVGKISKITDTLGREIIFHYDTNGDKLLAVSVPGIGTSPRVQTIRFYYESLTLQTQNRFDGTIDAPTGSISVLKYIYMPGTKSGYRYDYSTYYGMIYKMTQLRGMDVSTMDTSQMGSVTENTYTEAALTRYNYPGTDVEPPAPTLTDLPKYNKRTDDWIGRPGATAPQTLYNITEDTDTRKTQITAPNNTVSATVFHKKPGQWDDGLIKETYVTSAGRTIPWSKTIYTWQEGQTTNGRRDPRVEKLESINEAGQSQARTFEYDNYNNQTKIREHGYAASGQVGTELRRTEIGYQTDGSWLARNLINLPTLVKTVVNNTTVSRTDYEYDNYQNQPLANTPGVIKHDPKYDPFTTETRQVRGSCKTYYQPPQGLQVCTEYNILTITAYDSATNYRGNVTKVTSYADATDNNDPNKSARAIKYDITGNVVEASLSCCNVKTIEYSATNHYAYPTKETKGDSVQLVNQATYDFNTGLVTQSTNENNQITYYQYESDTFRQKKVIYPNGGYVETEFSDKLASGSVPGFIRTTATLEANKTVQSYSYFDGRGLGIRSATETTNGWQISVADFDNLGRTVKAYNPFYASTPNSAVPAGTKFTEVTNYDAIGRTTSVKLQDNTTVSTSFSNETTTPVGFDKTFVTVTDQAGKQRRQLMDALGRLVRVDEPDTNGNLGAVATPIQPTTYEYDGNDNLIKTIQADGAVTQERLFKYDSLSRLTHERQVEATPTLNTDGLKGSSSPTKWTKVLKYNTDGLLTEGTDARGVKTTFGYDGLNRISSVSYTGETNYQTPTVNYTYDEIRSSFYNKGNLTKVTTAAVGGTQETPATEQILDYDEQGQVVKHQQNISGQNYLLEYNYNLAGQLVSEKYPSGRIVNVGYDAKGRMSMVADANRNYLNGISFNDKTLPSQINYGNGTSQTFGYNDRLQMTLQELKRGSETIQKYNYGFGQIDSSGNLDTAKNNGQLAQIESNIGTNKQWTQKFSYDSIGRLGEAEEKRGDTNALSYKQKFDYDKFGNLFRKASSNPTTGQENPIFYEPIEGADIDKTKNQFTSATGTIYNEAGQVVTDNKFRDMSFSYDANGRMIKTSKANVPDDHTVYDALGNRVATRINDIWQFTIYDAFGKLVAEYGGLQLTDEGGVNYILRDHQGSPRASISGAGYIQSRTDYQAFGGEINSGVGLRTVTQGFGGEINAKQGYGLTEKDEASGLDHTWFRKLENQAGRWTSPDPYNGSMSLGNPQSFNRYSYVNNQPTNYVDPSGLVLRYFDVDGGLGCVLNQSDGKFHCTQYINRYWYDDGIGSGGGSSGFEPSGGGGGGRDDLPSNIRDFIKNNQGQIDRCVNFVFGQKADGTASKVAERMPGQTLKNAPKLSHEFTRSQLENYTSVPDTLAAPGYKKGTNGTVYISKDEYLGTNGKSMISNDQVARAFVHEWGNILAYRNTGNWSEFGDPAGIGSSFKDTDTGARFEKCVFGNVSS